MARRTGIVTLLTDFGSRDPYVAAMKGALLRAAPSANIVDISHEMPGHDILAASFALAQAAPYFPPGTLHVVVVDPGVGTERRIMAARFGGQVYLFPDNGVITFVASAQPLEEIVSVRSTRYLPQHVSATFHGRDIFAPLAGHILGGLDLRHLGPQPDTYKLLELPEPQQSAAALVGEVIYVDHWGNLISNIPEALVRQRFGDVERLVVTCEGQEIGPLCVTYGFVPRSQPLALFNSMGYLEVAVNRGSAAAALSASGGSEVRIEYR
jgi:S-adenosylmethionine hydrolase